MNAVPTTDAGWSSNPYEAQYLKLYDITAPIATPGTPSGPNVYAYEIGNTATFTWQAAGPDSEGVTPSYKVNISINGGAATSFFTSNTSYTVTAQVGQTVTVTVQAANPDFTSNAGPASSASATVKLLNATADEDGDGTTNAAEKTAGTNPLDSLSIFRITSIERASGDVIVSWKTVSGKTYVVQSAPALGSPTGWTDITGSATAGNGGTVAYTVTGAAASDARYYRVRLGP
jgi:hypothetical protein